MDLDDQGSALLVSCDVRPAHVDRGPVLVEPVVAVHRQPTWKPPGRRTALSGWTDIGTPRLRTGSSTNSHEQPENQATAYGRISWRVGAMVVAVQLPQSLSTSSRIVGVPPCWSL